MQQPQQAERGSAADWTNNLLQSTLVSAAKPEDYLSTPSHHRGHGTRQVSVLRKRRLSESSWDSFKGRQKQ